MKLRLVLLPAMLLFLASCSRQNPQPEFATVAVDTLLHANETSCRIEYRFASIRNAAKSPALETIEQANIGYFFQLEAFSGPAAEAVEASLRDIRANYLADGTGQAGAEYEISAEAEGSTVDSLLCYVITRSMYTGGAHGMYGTECHTYSLADGFELSLVDLFSEAELRRLDELIHRKIKQQYEAANDEALAQTGFFPEYIAPTENFRITSEGITFYYNPYDIGCYALGAVEVTVTRNELAAGSDPEPDSAE